MDIVIVEDDQIFNDTINKYIELKHLILKRIV